MTQGAPDSERSQPSDAAPLPQLPPVRLLMHGEDKAQGGPSLRVPRTAAELRALGYAAQSTQIRSVLDCPEDVAHLFNVWPPNDALRLLRQLKSAGKTVIFSPIYLDLGLHDFWQARLPFMALDDAAAVAEEANRVRAHLGGRGARPEILPGYHGMLREMLRLADHVVFLSAAERAALAEMGASVPDTRASVVPNPVDAALWRDGDPALFRDAYLEPGEDYVVCVGRIEERKNQLLLARALRDTSMRLVLIGRQAHPAYAERVIEEAGDRLILPGRLEPGGAMLRSALAGARAFALPSWCEGTSLAALEAAAAGLPLVLSDLPGERDSFGALAEYCDPGDPASIAAAVMRAAERGPAPEPERAAFAERHSWQQHARATAEAYATALAAPRAAPEVLRAAPSAVVLDVSALSRAEPHSFGSVRAVQRMAEALLEQEPDARCIAWHEAAQVFADIPSRFVKAGRVASYMAGLTGPGVPAASLPHGAVVVLASPVWAEDRDSLTVLEDLKAQAGLRVVALVHDLAALRHPYLFAADVATRFREGATRLLQLADRVIVHNDYAASEATAAAASVRRGLLDVVTIPFGSTAPQDGSEDDAEAVIERFAGKRFALAPGDWHPRFNPDLLRRIWLRLAEDEADEPLHLVIAGRVAAEGMPALDRVARDARINGQIHILNGTTEAEQAWLYRHCLVTLFPGEIPAWVSPAAESAHFGKPCLASRGALPDAPDALDAEDFAAWTARIATLSETPAEPAQAIDVSGWDETARALVAAATTPFEAPRGPKLLSGEAALAWHNAPPLMLRFDDHWHAAEPRGRRLAKAQGTVRLRADGCVADGQGDLLVLVELATGAPHRRLTPLRLCAGETPLFTLPPGDGAIPSQVLVRVPATALDGQGDLALTLHAPAFGGPEGEGYVALVAVTLLDPHWANPLAYLHNSVAWSDGKGRLHIDLSRDRHRALVAPGLSFSPAWGAGSAGGAVQLALPLLPGAGPLRLTVLARPVADADTPVTLTAALNGTVLATQTCTTDMPLRLRLAVPAALLADTAPAVLSVVADSVATPADLALGATREIAGFGLTDLFVTPEED